ncbi:unnamed protein product [Moneuplotes crassus]|uniref:Uncharacterized protein n=1 Tax=Euplotes crassus TaxID=5936 RepID=A0AAD1U2Q5_EUPCR|nr:unnamed protein product [Moneuplotes crassus]
MTTNTSFQITLEINPKHQAVGGDLSCTQDPNHIQHCNSTKGAVKFYNSSLRESRVRHNKNFFASHNVGANSKDLGLTNESQSNKYYSQIPERQDLWYHQIITSESDESGDEAYGLLEPKSEVLVRNKHTKGLTPKYPKYLADSEIYEKMENAYNGNSFSNPNTHQKYRVTNIPNIKGNTPLKADCSCKEKLTLPIVRRIVPLSQEEIKGKKNEMKHQAPTLGSSCSKGKRQFSDERYLRTNDDLTINDRINRSMGNECNLTLSTPSIATWNDKINKSSSGQLLNSFNTYK